VEFDGDVECVSVPGTQGRFEILQDHAPIISSLENGEVTYSTRGGDSVAINILGGFVEVQKNNVSLCVEI